MQSRLKIRSLIAGIGLKEEQVGTQFNPGKGDEVTIVQSGKSTRSRQFMRGFFSVPTTKK